MSFCNLQTSECLRNVHCSHLKHRPPAPLVKRCSEHLQKLQFGTRWWKGTGKFNKDFNPFTLSVLSRAQLFATGWAAARQAPLSMGFSRQGYWSALPFPSPGYLPDSGIGTLVGGLRCWCKKTVSGKAANLSFQFSLGETEAQRAKVMCSRTHSQVRFSGF